MSDRPHHELNIYALSEQDIDRIADRVVTKALRWLISLSVAFIVAKAFMDSTAFGEGIVRLAVASVAAGATIWGMQWLLERNR